MRTARSGMALALAVALAISSAMMVPAPAQGQTEDPTGVKRAFLDRYLDCAEAPDAAARLACYDALLLDIPAWLAGPAVPGAVPALDPEANRSPGARPCADD